MELTGVGFFLEVAIVGAGATVWFALATLSVTGYKWISPDLFGTQGLLLLALPLAFILGIIIDAVGDELFEGPKGVIRENSFGPDHEAAVIRLRREAYASPSEQPALEYVRRRLRIARGWVVNSAALAISLNAFVWLQAPDSLPLARISIWGSAAAILLTVGSIFATRSLLTSECEILKHFYDGRSRPRLKGKWSDKVQVVSRGA